jgi:hypothetical protein
MIGFRRQLTQQDGLFRALLQYLWRDNIGTSSGESHFSPYHCGLTVPEFKAKSINFPRTILRARTWGTQTRSCSWKRRRPGGC